jgi:hypothetical protein
MQAKPKFYKVLITCVLFIFVYISTYAQTDWSELPWRDHSDYKLQPLNKAYVATNILYDRVFPLANADEYKGALTDSNKNLIQMPY